jgi:hypothetical protein
MDGERYTDGEATLRIMDRDGRANVELSIRAWNEQRASWTARLTLPGEALLEDAAALALGQHFGAVQIQRLKQRTPQENASAASIAFRRINEPDRRPYLQGSISTESSATSAEFRTEYRVECLVPPEALGQEPNGRPQEASISVYLTDERFATPFCQKFEAIR